MTTDIINKQCPTCQAFLPVTDFYSNRSKADGCSSLCKQCTLLSNRRSRLNRPPDKAAERQRAKLYYHRTIETRRAQAIWSVMKSNYGITRTQYLDLVEQQDNLCGICKQPPPQGKRLSVDHCHATGKIRGLLCQRCNLALGKFGDSLEGLEKAVAYLRASIE